MYALIHPIEPFDVSTGGQIDFSWHGNQIFTIECIIKNNETGEQVYIGLIESMKSRYKIPADSGLKNGTCYSAYIIVTDEQKNRSALQPNGSRFYCFSTPIFELKLPSDNIIRNSLYEIELNYAQPEHELLKSYTISLYSHQKSLIQTSGPLYPKDTSGNSEAPDNIRTYPSYLITGLENANEYYLRATGTTKNGIYLDTQDILITVAYKQAQIFSTLELNNNADAGAIEIRSNIISAKGESEQEVIYLDDPNQPRYADLRDNSVTFDIGYLTSGDFSKSFIFCQPNLNQRILNFSESAGEQLMNVDVIYREGSYADSNGTQAYFELRASYGFSTYVRFSNFVNIPNQNQMFALCITRLGHCYELQAALVAKEA